MLSLAAVMYGGMLTATQPTHSFLEPRQQHHIIIAAAPPCSTPHTHPTHPSARRARRLPRLARHLTPVPSVHHVLSRVTASTSMSTSASLKHHSSRRDADVCDAYL
jgi:hypothetical protein